MWIYFLIILLLLFIFHKPNIIEDFSTVDTKFITLTNDGYIDYTLNCYKSMQHLNLDLHAYAIGDKAYNKIKSLGHKCTLIDEENNDNKNFVEFRTKNWHNITKQKFKIIHENLLKYKYVCFTDGDIVYERNAIKYCKKHIGNKDILIQNDTLSDDDHSNLCSGFMFIKSNAKTRKLFDPEIATKDAVEGWGDQIYINSIKNALDYKLLPLKLFPNGQYYYKNLPNSYIIHFNWIVGHEKQNKMKQYKKWYIIN